MSGALRAGKAPDQERQVLDVYSPPGAKNIPVVFWIHGGGWQTGDKTSVQIKPQAFVDKGFIFVATNYRLLPSVVKGKGPFLIVFRNT